MSEIVHWYLHVDLDAFFASVEQLDNPEYRGKPVIVGGKPEDRRSVVSTASYEARKYGVHSAMPTFQAYKLCPNGIYVHGRMQRYSELSYQIMNIFREYSPDVDQMSIDEAFIDITGTEKLFGPPEVVARKIKEHVKKQTGLTVSVGIATTKYLAKICSGFQKPDGLTYIHKGDEQKFMMELPLNKVWGLGPKSLELIRSKGINTTREIYEKTFDSLEFLFGKNMASFLYNVVRGGESETFSKEAKKHSISAETTFPYDLTDIYTIETEILELAHGVFFRLLKKDEYSRTAFIKIRYDDFSTCTVQETVDKNILTVDSFFEILKRLFEKKYISGRGIRLLGVGFDNIEKEDKPYQQDLFSTGDDKKQAVEKAILNLEKKHPDIKVRKARTFKSVILFLILLTLPKKAIAETTQIGAGTVLPDILHKETLTTGTALPENEENTETTTNSTPDQLFKYEISGFWQSELTTSLISSFATGTAFNVAMSSPVFKQEVELSALLSYKNNWFFQADFADAFKKNTLTIGYKDGNYLKLAKVSNRNITAPDIYSLSTFGYSLGGGENQAPGLSFHFESPENKWIADFLLRYDMTTPHSATFFGMNTVTDTKISPENFVYGRFFHFPENTSDYLTAINNIYVESKNGTYIDSDGKKYKKLSHSDYIYISSKQQLVLSNNANSGKQDNFIPNILITFNSPTAVQSIILQTGSYSDPSSFAGNIQQLFNQADNYYDLSKFASKTSTRIENEEALIIQSSNSFSPYVLMNVYDCGISTDADLSVISTSTETTLSEFSASFVDDSYTSIFEDLFHENHKYSQIIQKNSTQNYYPFAKNAPEIYLNLQSSNDISILMRSYSPVTQLTIGNDVSIASVQVYKNGILDNNATYDASTGSVTLSSTVLPTDKIFITWQEDSEDFSNGSISALAGYLVNFTDKFKSDIALSFHWPLTFKASYSTPEDIQSGFLALAGGIEYNSDLFTLTDKTSFALQKENATDGLLVSSQEDISTETYYLSYNAGYETKVSPVLHTDNSTIILDKQFDATVKNFSGITSSDISGYAIPLSWTFTNKNNWASVDIALSSGNLLNNASSLEIALRPEIPLQDSDLYEVYLQLGIKAENDFTGEDTDSIPCWKLDLDLSKQEWQTVTVPINQYQRSKLASYHDARIIVFTTGTALPVNPANLYIGPYQPHAQSVYVYASPDVNISTTTQSYSKAGELYSSSINWNIPVTTDISTLENTIISTESNFSAADLSNYNNVDFDFALNVYNQLETQNIQNESNFTLTLDTHNTDDISLANTALNIKFNNIFNLINDTNYHTLTINLTDNRVYIDNNLINPAEYVLYINKSVVPTHQKVSLNTHTGNIIYKNGTFTLGAIYYNDNDLSLIGKNYAEAQFHNDISHLKLSSLQSTGNLFNPDFIITSNASGDITYAGIKTSGDISLSQTDISTAGHSINTVNKLFNIISLGESYRYNLAQQTTSKADNLSFDFNGINVPVKLSFETQGTEQFNLQTQNTGFNFNVDYKSKTNYGVLFDTKLNLSQKVNTLDSKTAFNNDNYFTAWYDSSKLEFSTGDEFANIRNIEFTTKLGGLFPFAKFNPSITYKTNSIYNNNTDNTFTDKSTISLILPFTFGKNNISFNYSRLQGRLSPLQNTTSYITDAQTFFNLQSDRSWFFTSIPIYEMFDKNMINNITADYSSKYEITYKRNLFNSTKDLYVPSAFTLAAIRDIKNTSVLTDIYQYKASITNTSINNFGSDSLHKTFKWFKQEELITNLTGIVKVPTDMPENTIYQISAYIQLLLMITDKANITSAFDCSFETDNTWNTHGTIIYNRPSDSSLISSLIYFIKPSTKDTFAITRKDLFNYELSQTDNIFRQNYNYQHSVDLNFLKYYTITFAMGTAFNYTQNSTNNLSLNLTIGAKAEF